MNQDDPFTGLHATTAAELDGLLDVEAGLREALIAAQHARTGYDLGLDVEAGLGAIVAIAGAAAPSTAADPERPSATPDRSDDLHGAVAARLMSLDDASRLALRNHSAIVALALTLEITKSLAISLAIAGDLDRDSPVNHVRVQELTRALDRALDHAEDLAHYRAFARDLAHAHARDLAHALDHARDLAHDHARDLAHDLAHDLDHDLAHAHALTHDLALDRARNDFTGADLSEVDLSKVSLTGIRWSMGTRWPSDEWRAQALLNSQDLGDGTYEIRGGTTNVPVYST